MFLIVITKVFILPMNKPLTDFRIYDWHFYLPMSLEKNLAQIDTLIPVWVLAWCTIVFIHSLFSCVFMYYFLSIFLLWMMLVLDIFAVYLESPRIKVPWCISQSFNHVTASLHVVQRMLCYSLLATTSTSTFPVFASLFPFPRCLLDRLMWLWAVSHTELNRERDLKNLRLCGSSPHQIVIPADIL
jgi:hypothetical protein